MSMIELDYTGIKKIISGGQYGADEGGLLAAKEAGIPTGGWAPKNWMTVRGPRPELQELYELQECMGGYRARTMINVQESDATLIVASDQHSPGTVLTIYTCRKFKKPWMTVHPSEVDASVQKVSEWIKVNHVEILNVAGNRDTIGSKHRDAAQHLLSQIISINISSYKLGAPT